MNFKLKKVLAVIVILIFAFSGACFAKGKAGGGGIKATPPASSTTKSLAPSSKTQTETPKADTNKANSSTTTNHATNSNNTNATNNTNTNANTANTANKTNQTNTTANQQSGSRWGSALRNIGLFAGGMFLGSMLSSMFGMGGLFGDIFGAIFNIILVGIVVMLLMTLFRKLFGKKKDSNVYASSRYAENNVRCENCGWVSPDRNNPPKFCPECGNRMNSASTTNYNSYQNANEFDADYRESSNNSSRKIIDITPPKDKDK